MEKLSDPKVNFKNQQLKPVKKVYLNEAIPSNLSCTAGDKVLLKLVDGEIYTGKFYSQNPNNGRLSIFDVVSVATGQAINCLCNFYPNEIREICLYKASVEDTTAVQEIEESGDENDKLENCKISHSEIQRLKNMVKSYIMLKEINDEFEMAINYLSKCDILSIDGKNSEFGKNAKISLLVISSWDQAYVFDLKLIGEEVFSSKLRDVLQSKCVTKVVYNSKKLVECLIHQHNIHLQNIYDVNIAHLHISNETIEDIPNQKQLNNLLMHYFNIPTNVIDTTSNIGKWTRRPIIDVLQKTIAENAIYLIPLYNEIDKLINKKHYNCMRSYLNSIRCEDAGRSHYLCSVNELSDEFKSLMANEN